MKRAFQRFCRAAVVTGRESDRIDTLGDKLIYKGILHKWSQDYMLPPVGENNGILRSEKFSSDFQNRTTYDF